MKKLNLLNKVYLIILVLLILATAIKLWRYGGGSRYYYSASVTAPATYPIHVLEAGFILSDGSDGDVKTEGVNDKAQRWGWGDFPETREREQLPVKLLLNYVSYREQCFYKDTIDLPAQLIDSIFKRSEKAGIRQSIYKTGNDVMGLNFLIGVANKGNVLIWLQGEKYERVLLKHKITAREPLAADLYYGKLLTKKEYMKEVFSDLGDEVLKQIAAGADKDANYIDSASNHLR